MCIVRAAIFLECPEDADEEFEELLADDESVRATARGETLVALEPLLIGPLTSALRVELGAAYIEGSMKLEDTRAQQELREVWVVVSFEVADRYAVSVETMNRVANLGRYLLAPEVNQYFGFPTILRRIALS